MNYQDAVTKVNTILKDHELSAKMRRRIEELIRKSPLTLGRMAVNLVVKGEIDIDDLTPPDYMKCKLCKKEIATHIEGSNFGTPFTINGPFTQKDWFQELDTRSQASMILSCDTCCTCETKQVESAVDVFPGLFTKEQGEKIFGNNPLTLVHGKCYENRDGKQVFVFENYPGTTYPFEDSEHMRYMSDGKYIEGDDETRPVKKYDLVKEV